MPSSKPSTRRTVTGWLTSGAVRKAHKTWDEQVQNLMNRLSSDKAALRQGNTTLQGTDADVGAMARTTSPYSTCTHRRGRTDRCINLIRTP
ncbi:hypothetical protein SALBM311S_08242 [Streptomyces alboniger]